MCYRYLHNRQHDCITCLRWLSKGIWHSPQINDPGYSQPVQCAKLSYQWYYPDVQWYLCLRLDGTRSDRMVQDHLWCPPRRYAITYLFIVLLDYALKKILPGDVGFVVCKRNGRRHPAIHIGVLAYADDICLLAESIGDVECSLHRHETSSVEIGVTINCNKTKAMHLGQASIRHVRFAFGDPVDSCDKFAFLGVPTFNAETVFRSRLSKAWAALIKLRSIFNSKANDAIEIGICRSAVESIPLFGLECLQLTSTLQDKLDSAYRRILRYALGGHFPDCISNAELTRRTGATAL